MGNPVSKIFQLYGRVPSVSKIFTGMRTANPTVGRKRKRSKNSDVSDSEILEPPALKKHKLDGTLNYVYKTLYLEGKDSDILVIALDRTWKLHKVYLCQSPYFDSMFNGSWKEAQEKIIQIEIYDPYVTLNSLHVVFSSLYLHEMTFEAASPVEILAAATLFQLEYVIDKCANFMVETITVETVIEYYEASLKYGVAVVRNTCICWMLNNLTHFGDDDAKGFPTLEVLRSISVDLMRQLVGNVNFLFIGTENFLYQMLVKWVAVHLNPDWIGTLRSIDRKLVHPAEKGEPFLLTEKGEHFAPAFKALRLKHLIRFRSFYKNFESDNIIPKSWVFPHVIDVWDKMLSVFGGCETGPCMHTVSETMFDKECMRFGRHISQPSNQYVWRWYPFTFGINLYWNWCLGKLTLSRAYDSRTENNRVANMVNNWKIMVRITVYCSNPKGELVFLTSSGIKSAALNADTSEVKVELGLNHSKMNYPIFLLAHVLLVSPKISPEDSVPNVVVGESGSSNV